MHEDLVEEAKKAINTVFSDTSVSQETTLSSLKDIWEEIGTMIDTIENDIETSTGE